jgi:hypothetical protein
MAAAYLVENAGRPQYLAYTTATEGRDRHVEAICAPLRATLAAEADSSSDPISTWRDWLSQRDYPAVSPVRLPNGVLRAVLPAEAFGDSGRFRLYQLGSFEVRRRTFMQLWCADERLRRRAALDRARQMARSGVAKTEAELETRLRQLADQLEVTDLSIAELT